MKTILFATLLISQLSVFAYQMVDVSPATRAVNYCAKQLEGKFPGAALDDDRTMVKPEGAWTSNGGFFEVSTPFKASNRSGTQVMKVYVFSTADVNKVYGWQIVWSDGKVEEIKFE
jgi:hypothetical protein